MSYSVGPVGGQSETSKK